jgi:hypothetical protein
MPMSRISSDAILDKLWNRLSGLALPTIPCFLGPISSDAILDKLWNRLSGLALPTVPCFLGPIKVHHALYDWELA